jgi:hypothetical protein
MTDKCPSCGKFVSARDAMTARLKRELFQKVTLEILQKRWRDIWRKR